MRTMDKVQACRRSTTCWREPLKVLTLVCPVSPHPLRRDPGTGGATVLTATADGPQRTPMKEKLRSTLQRTAQV